MRQYQGEKRFYKHEDYYFEKTVLTFSSLGQFFVFTKN